MLIRQEMREPKPLRITVVIPPMETKEVPRAFVNYLEAQAYAEKCPLGTYYFSLKVEGDVVEALWPSHGWKEKSDDV